MSKVTKAKQECDLRKISFAETFRFQFYASEEKRDDFAAFDYFPISGWHIYAGTGLKAHLLLDRSERALGVFMGRGVDKDGRLVDASFLKSLSALDEEFWSQAESKIEGVAGRFVFFIFANKEGRLYFDPVAHLSAVFNPATRVVASTPLLAIDDDLQDNPPFLTDDVLDKKITPMMGYTVDRRLTLVKANHYLALNRFCEVRHWPKAAGSEMRYQELSAEARAVILSERLTQIVKALSQKYPLAMPLSGGRDSRILAAATKEAKNDIGTYFAFANNKMTRIDVELGAEIARLMELSYLPIYPDSPKVEPRKKPFEYRQYTRKHILASGRNSTPAEPLLLGLMDPIPQDNIILRGGVIDILRAVWWRAWPKRRQIASTSDEAELRNLSMGNYDEIAPYEWIAERYFKWRERLLPEQRQLIHDYIFIELFYPQSWQGYYGIWEHFMMCPASDRMVIDLLLSFDVKERFQLEAFHSVLSALAPELKNAPAHFEYRRRDPKAGHKRVHKISTS